MTHRIKLGIGVLALAAALGSLAIPAQGAEGHPAGPPLMPPGMTRMHQAMADGNPGMVRMHELMMQSDRR